MLTSNENTKSPFEYGAFDFELPNLDCLGADFNVTDLLLIHDTQYIGEKERFFFLENYFRATSNRLRRSMATHTTVLVQQSQASTYNHPCGDLLDGGRRQDFLDIGVPLYTASIEGDLKAAKVILKGHGYLVRYSITERKETPLHVAAAGHSIKFVRYLVNMMSMVDLELQNEDGNTAFCIAAISGNVGMAKIMFEKNQTLPIFRGSENKMPLYLAAFHGNRDMVAFLYDQLSDKIGWTNDDMDGVLLKCIQADIFDVAQRILKENVELPQDKHASDVLQVLAQKRGSFYENRRFYFYMRFTSLAFLLVNNRNATPFLRLLWKRIMKRPKDVIDEILRGPMIEKDEMKIYPSRILFIAAKMNNTQFLVELIREYPDLIWKINDDGQTIFHISVSYRHRRVYRLLYEIGSMKNLITPITDQQGNNILHFAAMMPQKNGYEDWLTTPFQMFSEYLWYKEVKSILPPPYREVKNEAGQTPQELFIESHKDLVSEGMKSINDTINISMVVAALVCAIGFAVAYSIPGGFDEKDGSPVFIDDSYFMDFVLLDAISFLLSTTSVIFFLSIILSHRHRNMESLLRRWVTGQLLLLTSIFFLVVAFILSFFILYVNRGEKLTIYVFAYLIIASYVSVCLSLVINWGKAAYPNMSRLKQHVLYQKI
ncbi:hypothetical protein L1987_00057 [Smallanthus sonchifolius]|uniref:Uncharacterized protein n=1 Tax=Smallanthus sonchifolius TaxID=185202 RepID=A0ACB9K1A7_9ASTR|nr:hypothetical protein L1987_00057 [Smallanthus sonchifolius]